MKDKKQLTLMGLCLVALAGVLVFSAVAFAAPDAAIPQGKPAAVTDAAAPSPTPAAVTDAAEPHAGAAPAVPAPAPASAPEAPNEVPATAPAVPAPSPAAAPEAPVSAPAAAPADNGATGEIGAEAAKEAALAHAGLTASEVTFTKCKLDWEDGRQVYEVEFYTTDGAEYEYEIDAAAGTVLKWDYDGEHVVTGTTASGSAVSYMDKEQAQRIALDRVPGAAVSHLCKWELDRDDCAYEGEIVYDGCEYDFKLDACTGAVLEWEWEHCGDNGHHGAWHHG